jgi:hypothetical protein
MALRSGCDRIEGRDDRNSSGKQRDHLASEATKRPAGLPDTAMAAAFLAPLARWARSHRSNPVTIPTGIVQASELRLVMRGPGHVRNNRHRKGNSNV